MCPDADGAFSYMYQWSGLLRFRMVEEKPKCTFKSGKVKGTNLRIYLSAFGPSWGFLSITAAGLLAAPMNEERAGISAYPFSKKGVIKAAETTPEGKKEERMIDFISTRGNNGRLKW